MGFARQGWLRAWATSYLCFTEVSPDRKCADHWLCWTEINDLFEMDHITGSSPCLSLVARQQFVNPGVSLYAPDHFVRFCAASADVCSGSRRTADHHCGDGTGV